MPSKERVRCPETVERRQGLEITVSKDCLGLRGRCSVLVQPAHRSPQKPGYKDGGLLSLPFFKKETEWVPHMPVVLVLGAGAEVEGHPHPWPHGEYETASKKWKNLPRWLSQQKTLAAIARWPELDPQTPRKVERIGGTPQSPLLTSTIHPLHPVIHTTIVKIV